MKKWFYIVYRFYIDNIYKMNIREEMFAKYLEKKGLAWVFEQIRFQLKDTTYKPDFYCPDNDTFYDVIGTRQALHCSRNKIKELLKTYPDIKYKMVKPTGEKYQIKPVRSIIYGGKMKKIMENKLNFYLPIKLEKRLREFADRKAWNVSFIIREAIEKYLKEENA